MKKKLHTLALALFLCTSLLGMNVKAYEIKSTYTEIKNPLYKNLKTTERAVINPLQSTSYEICSNVEGIKKSALNHCREREQSFSITYTGNWDDLSNIRLLSEIFSFIKSTDDYTYFSLTSINMSMEGYDENITLTFNVKYLTTKAQELYVDKKVDDILSKIITSNMNIDKKEKAIHDYIVKNVAYDTSFTKYSAYDALYSGTTVCQGYALLTYKMLTKAGIETKIIEGTAGENHAWNLVNLRGNWYHLDCTWDDPIPDVKGRVLYNYYNLRDEDIAADHSWDRSYYPKSSTTKYVPMKYETLSTSGYKSMRYKNMVGLSKTWNIHLSKAADENTLTKDNVFIVKADRFDDSEMIPEYIPLNMIDFKIVKGTDNSIALVPNIKYDSNSTYYIVITSKLRSTDGKSVRSAIMKFSTPGYISQ